MPRMRSVLVTEDDTLVAEVLTDALQTAGYEVKVAGDGLEALAAIDERHFDVLVTDLKMPGLAGEGLIKLLRSTQPDLPIVVVTGASPVGGVDALRREGEAPVTVLLKPANLDDVVGAVARALDNAVSGKPTVRMG